MGLRVRGLEGLGGLGLRCEWLAGLVWEGLGCVGFVYKIVEITAGSSNNGGGGVVGLLCMGRAGSNLAVHFDFFLFFFPCPILIDRICVVTSFPSVCLVFIFNKLYIVRIVLVNMVMPVSYTAPPF